MEDRIINAVQLRAKLDAVRTEMMTNALQASVLLSAIIKSLDDMLKPTIPKWEHAMGVIDPDAIDDNTFDNGPIEITIVRIHQVNTNACQWEFRGAGAVQNDYVHDAFLEFVHGNHSYDEDGEWIPDEYMLKVLLGRGPDRKVRNAFLNGNLIVAGLDPDKVDQIFSDWKAFYQKEPVHQGFVVEEEGIDT